MSLIAQTTLSQLLSRIAELFAKASGICVGHPRSAVAISVAGLLFPWAVGNFRKYKALGHGGMPNFAVGWVVATLAKPVGRETTSTGEYVRDVNKEAWLKAGEGPQEIPLRGRPRPATGWHFLPHRQVEQYPDEKIRELLAREFRAIASANTELVQVQVSPHERFGDAMVVHASVPSPHKVADASWREIVHYHERKDFSMHATLAPQDCKLVIEQGWGERHPLSGVLALPKEYLFIYAPLNEDEVRVAGLIMRASVGYMTGKKDVQ